MDWSVLSSLLSSVDSTAVSIGLLLVGLGLVWTYVYFGSRQQDVAVKEAPPAAGGKKGGKAGKSKSEQTSVWRQLLVTVGGNTRIVYLDTSLQGLLYDPIIPVVDKNVATQFLFEFSATTGNIGPFHLRNRVTPSAAPVFSVQSDGNPSVYDIQLLDASTQQVYQALDPTPGPRNNKFAIYAEIPNDPDNRIYFRPTTPEQTGLPRRNQILGHQIPRIQWVFRENFVFQPGSIAPTDIIP